MCEIGKKKIGGMVDFIWYWQIQLLNFKHNSLWTDKDKETTQQN